MKLSVSAIARHELIETVRYIAQDNPSAARQLRNDIDLHLQRLTKFPLRYPVCYEAPDDTHEEVRRSVCRGFHIYYAVSEEAVSVLHILHHARDASQMLA